MIIDASVVIAWFVDILTSRNADPWQSRSDLTAPVFLEIELTNALLKYVRLNQFSGQQVSMARDQTRMLIADWVPDSDLLASATEIAIARNHKIYDCLYLALALERRRPLVTADRRLAMVARSLSIETELIEPSL